MSDIISRRDLAAAVADLTGLPLETAERVLKALGPSIAAALAQGKEVRLPRLARFLVRDRGEEEKEVLAQISTLFREEVLGPRTTRLLSVLDPVRDPEMHILLAALSAEGLCESFELHSVEDSDRPWLRREFDVILLGEHVTTEEYRALSQEVKLDPDRTGTRILRVVPAGADPFAVDALTFIPDEVFEKPFDPDGLEAALRGELTSTREDRSDYLQQVAVRLPSREGITDEITEILDRLCALTPLGDRRAAELVPAVREAVENAIRVGNQGDPTRYVDLTCLVDDEKVAVVVKDEGPVPEERRDWASARGGSGIASMIMKRGADEVEFLPPGNRVMLTKYY